ncbi:hypothetical protein ASE07_10030 [Noviherbaspirillum sp. Root189]|nr:hypothetical protein ASE07_10030 [Noviherbaspirillum sp. Root189]
MGIKERVTRGLLSGIYCNFNTELIESFSKSALTEGMFAMKWKRSSVEQIVAIPEYPPWKQPWT